MSRWAEGLRTSAGYVKGVWVRLNGGGRGMEVSSGLPDGLQMPQANKEARAAATKAISLEVSSLEKQLQEASKVQSSRRNCLFQRAGRTLEWGDNLAGSLACEIECVRWT